MQIVDNISEQYRQSIIAKEAIVEEEETEAPKQKGSKTECSSSRDTTLDQLMKSMKDMQKQLRLIPAKCAQVTNDVNFIFNVHVLSACMFLMFCVCCCR